MRISDWSSDVCSSDLGKGNGALAAHLGAGRTNRRRGHRIAAAALGLCEASQRSGRHDRSDNALSGRGGGALRSHRHHQSWPRSEEHTSELQSLMRISYAVFCLKTKKKYTHKTKKRITDSS